MGSIHFWKSENDQEVRYVFTLPFLTNYAAD